MPETESELVVFSGNSNKPLVEDICEYLEIPVGRCEVGKFSDGEIQIEIAENVRGLDPEHDQDLHTLRKASKTARYLAETGVDASKAAAALAARYEAAQKSLGEWHDHFLLLHEAHANLPADSETIEQIQQDTERLHHRADADASHLLATA